LASVGGARAELALAEPEAPGNWENSATVDPAAVQVVVGSESSLEANRLAAVVVRRADLVASFSAPAERDRLARVLALAWESADVVEPVSKPTVVARKARVWVGRSALVEAANVLVSEA
jgi:hypothetical protein